MPERHNASPQDTLLAAQPIYDAADQVAGVELLYRNNLGQTAMEVGEGRATSEVLFNFCTAITEHLDHFKQPAFINVSRDFLCSGAFLPIDPGAVVVELVERIEPDAELIDAVERWHDKGFVFALDDFEFKPSWEPLVRLASIIKVDIQNTSFEQALKEREQMSRYSLKWLAERVEDRLTHERYRYAGFDLFQGYFLARPAIVYGKKLSPAALTLARVISLLFIEEPDLDEVTQALSADPTLSVSLVRIVNSPLYKARQEVSSMKEVVMRLGILAIRRWAVLISSLNASSPEVARLVLVRAQACAALAEKAKDKSVDPASAFLAGLLSGADILLGVELNTFLEQLDLSEEVKNAALYQSGPIGKIVKIVVSLEQRVAMKERLEAANPHLLRLYEQSARNVQVLFNEVA